MADGPGSPLRRWTFRLGADPARGRSGGLTEPDEANALDDLAESYLAADPDLTVSFADYADIDDSGPDQPWPSLAITTSGWDALRSEPEPGTDVRHERAAWWDHAVQSGRTGRTGGLSRARQRFRPAEAAMRETTSAPEPTPPPPRPPKPERPRGQAPALGTRNISKPASTKPYRAVTPKPVGAPARPGKQDRATQPRPAPAPSPPQPPGPSRRRPAMAGVVALAVVLVAGGVVALALYSRDNGRKTNVVQSTDSRAARVRAAARLASDVASAATWVANQVDRTTKVACEPVMCHALADDGFPGQRLDEIGRGALSPFGATIVVDTPALRGQFGTNLEADWAPTVLAGFGVGVDRITVRVLAPHGATAYEAALRADRKQRQMVGASLLTSSQITTTQAARSALAAGDVDDRLLLVITALASQHPIDILAFGRTWSGTSAGIPMRTAYLAEADPAAYLTEPVYVQAMIDLLRAQPPAYRPANAGFVRLAGRKVLSIWFTAPSPLGLINANP